MTQWGFQSRRAQFTVSMTSRGSRSIKASSCSCPNFTPELDNSWNKIGGFASSFPLHFVFARTEMEHQENSTASLSPHTRSPAHAQTSNTDGNAFLYILIVISFYGVFLCGIMLGYFRSKRREKKRVNIFTRLVHDEERREWGALPKKHSHLFPGAASPLQASLQFCGNHGNHFGHVRSEGALPFPLACALCTEQSSVSSLCSSAETRCAIEEESDSGTAEENTKGGSENSGDDSG